MTPNPAPLLDGLAAVERYKSREHQAVGVQWLTTDSEPNLGRVIPKVYALLDEVGAGKTKQVVDSALILFGRKDIDTVCVITPGNARSTWADPDPLIGEVAKHAWTSVPTVVHEYHGNYQIAWKPENALHWVVTNYEFIRRENRRDILLKALTGRRTWLVLDEAWTMRGFSQQMRACRMIRVRRADRATLLNGTPLADGKPTDLFYPFGILDPDIIGCRNKREFVKKFCVVEEVPGGRKQVVGYQNQDELNRRVAPYVLARRTRDCWDLPPMLPPLTLEAKLSDENWRLYKQMRDDAAAWLGTKAATAEIAFVKMVRLAQITSGYLGGLEEMNPNAPAPTPPPLPIPDWLAQRYPQAAQAAQGVPDPTAQVGRKLTKEIGREKLDALLDWFRSIQRPDKALIWCRFRKELERATEAMREIYPTVLQLRGGQTPDERRAAKRLLAPGGDPNPGCVVGTQRAGGASMNYAASSLAVYLSNGPALLERTQSLGRVERPGAKQPILIVDVVATGPKGQKTIDHKIIHALRAKDDMARWTVGQWRKIMEEAA